MGVVMLMSQRRGKSFQVEKVVDQLSHCHSSIHTWAGDPVPTHIFVLGHLGGACKEAEDHGPRAGSAGSLGGPRLEAGGWCSPFMEDLIPTQTALGFLMKPVRWAVSRLGLSWVAPQGSLARPAWTPRGGRWETPCTLLSS